MKQSVLKITLIIVISYAQVHNVKSQDIQFSQFHIADLLINPALAGAKHRNRFMFHHRMQWPKLQGKYQSSLFSYDTYLDKYRSGVGAYVSVDDQGGGILRTTNVNVLYSYEMPVTQKWAVRFGLQGGIIHKALNDDGLIYSDQVTPDGIDPNEAREFLDRKSYVQPDMGTGILIYNERFWFGASFYHFNKPQQKMLGEGPYPERIGLKAGYKIPLKKLTESNFSGTPKEFYLFPVIHYKAQGKSDQFEIGADLINHQLRLGMWYRGIPFKKYNDELHNNESIILLVGWRYHGLEISYSYDVVFSELEVARTGGAHEVHISYIFPTVSKAKKYRTLPCPDFQRSKNLPKQKSW